MIEILDAIEKVLGMFRTRFYKYFINLYIRNHRHVVMLRFTIAFVP